MIRKRSGKVYFTTQSMINVPKPEDLDDIALAFKNNQSLLNRLLTNCRSEEKDSKVSLKALKDMLAESNIAQTKFNMVFNILEELEGADSRAIEQLFYYKVNGL